MTLAELLADVKKLSVSEKIKLIRSLAEELDSDEDISPLQPFKTYYLPTPYNLFGVGKALMEEMNQTNQT